MDHHNAVQWLFDHGGPVVRYRVASEFKGAINGIDTETLTVDLLKNDIVNKWLDNLKPYESMVDAQQRGKGPGARGKSSFLHGSSDLNIEVVLPKLAQLGLRAGMPVLDEKTSSWLKVLEAELEKDTDRNCSSDSQFLSVVYAHSDRQLIIASSLALAGYFHHEAVARVLHSRLEAIYEVIKDGTFDIYEPHGTLNIRPRAWTNHILKWELYSDGNIPLPFIHDICGFASLYQYANQQVKQKIDTIIQWILAPEHQHFLRNYGYIRCPGGLGKSVGHKMNFPGYSGYDNLGFDPRSLVLRCWQMAHFPEARNHPWFHRSMDLLLSFVSERGTYIFPKGYLTEKRERGYWIHGERMGLGENRRNPEWCETESTFWMLAILWVSKCAG